MKYVAPAYLNEKVMAKDVITASYVTEQGVHVQETVNEDGSITGTLTVSIKNLLG